MDIETDNIIENLRLVDICVKYRTHLRSGTLTSKGKLSTNFCLAL